jgi:hypothetical protein
MDLLRSQTTWMQDAMRRASFNPADFQPLKAKDAGGTELVGWTHVPTDFFFLTGEGYVYEDVYFNFDGGWKVVASPGATERRHEEIVRDWGYVQVAFDHWLVHLRREIT